jgi:inosose dehydratase
VTLHLATGPVSWGVDFADAPGNPPWRELLDGVVAAGYAAIELGPLDYLPRDVGPELQGRGLRLTGGFVFEPLHEPEALPATLATARRTADRIAELGGEYLTIIDVPARGGSPDAVGAAVEEVAEIARSRQLRPLVHPHGGTCLRFDGLERLLDLADLCLDTGHALYEGWDPVELYRRWADRVGCVHLKDLDPARVNGSFWDAVRAGAFRPLGDGALDLRALLGTLAAGGFDGWCVVEQDRVPGGDPVADLVTSRMRLEAVA